MPYSWNILGHEDQIAQLECDMESDNLSHAYLFTGPEGIGKFTVAKRFTTILQCPFKGCSVSFTPAVSTINTAPAVDENSSTPAIASTAATTTLPVDENPSTLPLSPSPGTTTVSTVDENPSTPTLPTSPLEPPATSSSSSPSPCPTCLQIAKGHHFDTIEIPDDGQTIKIKDLRALIDRVNMSNQSHYSIILIKNAARMTLESANCLLKTLEEPPRKTIFLLTVAHSSQILPTIISRSRKIAFHLPPAEKLTTGLTLKFPSLSPKDIPLALTLSLLRPGPAISLLENPEKFAEKKEKYRQISAILEDKSVAKRFQYVNTLVERPENIDENMKEFIDIFLAILREKMLTTNLPSYHRLLAATQKLPQLKNRNVNTRLLLENLMLSL